MKKNYAFVRKSDAKLAVDAARERSSAPVHRVTHKRLPKRPQGGAVVSGRSSNAIKVVPKGRIGARINKDNPGIGTAYLMRLTPVSHLNISTERFPIDSPHRRRQILGGTVIEFPEVVDLIGAEQRAIIVEPISLVIDFDDEENEFTFEAIAGTWETENNPGELPNQLVVAGASARTPREYQIRFESGHFMEVEVFLTEDKIVLLQEPMVYLTSGPNDNISTRVAKSDTVLTLETGITAEAEFLQDQFIEGVEYEIRVSVTTGGPDGLVVEINVDGDDLETTAIGGDQYEATIIEQDTNQDEVKVTAVVVDRRDYQRERILQDDGTYSTTEITVRSDHAFVIAEVSETVPLLNAHQGEINLLETLPPKIFQCSGFGVGAGSVFGDYKGNFFRIAEVMINISDIDNEQGNIPRTTSRNFELFRTAERYPITGFQDYATYRDGLRLFEAHVIDGVYTVQRLCDDQRAFIEAKEYLPDDQM